MHLNKHLNSSGKQEAEQAEQAAAAAAALRQLQETVSKAQSERAAAQVCFTTLAFYY